MQNSAKTTKNALLQNADNERIAMYSLEEESKVEKDKGEYGCCVTTIARVITSTTTNDCRVFILLFKSTVQLLQESRLVSEREPFS
nr:hypothetical protein [uncultured Bacteroides sp.]